MKVIITAGGSGGHIYPALAIADKIKEKEPKSEIIYVGTHNRMEKEIVPKRGYEYKELEIYGFSKKDMKRNFKNIFLIKKATKQCLKLIKEFKPDIVIGVGGYVTYPVIKAANKLKIKTLIHEQNSIPGKSNIVLSRKADKIAISFEDSKKYFNKEKCVLTGNPSSESAFNIKKISKTEYGLDKNKKSIVIVQGSQGSASVNEKIKPFLKNIDNEYYDVLYITGSATYDKYSKNKFSKNVKIVPYVDNLPGLLKDVDLVISRAGASTIFELSALLKPSILIPSPYVANNHQYYNALSMQKLNAAELIEERDLNEENLKEKINKILNNEKLYKQMIENLEKLAIRNSSTIIYEEIKKLLK